MTSDPADKAPEARGCATCAYDMGPCWDDCTFPEPQDGSEPLFIVQAVMPSRHDGGKNCMQYRRALVPR